MDCLARARLPKAAIFAKASLMGPRLKVLWILRDEGLRMEGRQQAAQPAEAIRSHSVDNS